MKLDNHFCCNATTFGVKGGEGRARWHFHVTFWHRSMASCGWAEAWRSETNYYLAVHVLGYALSIEYVPSKRGMKYWHMFRINMPWLAYDRNRGGIFCHWKWAQRLAQKRRDDAENFKLRMQQLRTDWFLRRSGNWWSFDRDPRKAWYKHKRAVYGMSASEAWADTKKHWDGDDAIPY